MCSKAEEIQKQWKRNVCDFVAEYHPCAKYPRIQLYRESSFDGYEIWLPRQDQLQAMISYGSNWVLLNRFHGFVFNILKKYNPDASMEMFWIQFVMFRNYRKSWNGSEWIAEQEEQ